MMVGPGDEIAPPAGGHGHWRASDSDRAHVVDTVKAAYVDGLVTKDEFDARVSQTFASRTHAELALVIADIPAGLAAAHQRPRPAPAPAPSSAPAHANVGPGGHAIIATAIFAVLALVISISAGPFASPAAVLLVFGGAGSAFLSLFLLGTKMRGAISAPAVNCLRSEELTPAGEFLTEQYLLPRQKSPRTPVSLEGEAGPTQSETAFCVRE